MPRSPDDERRWWNSTETSGISFSSTNWTINLNVESEVNVPETPFEPINVDVIPSGHLRGISFSDRRGNPCTASFVVNDPRNIHNVEVHFWALMRRSERVSAYQRILDWANENNVTLVPVGFEAHDGARIAWKFQIKMEGEQWVNKITCPVCSQEVFYPNQNCRNCGCVVYCPQCTVYRDNIHLSDDGNFCGDCGTECENCGGFVSPNLSYCSNCNPHHFCSYCDSMCAESDMVYHEQGGWYCSYCANSLCHSCGNVVDEYSIDHESGMCYPCVGKSEIETFDSEDADNNKPLEMPTIPGRETIRLCGIEIEGANGNVPNGMRVGNILAERLFDVGLAEHSEMTGYHSGGNRRFSVHVERDSSVDWELVIGPINFANVHEVRALNSAVGVARSLVRDGTAKLDMRGGLHVHVSALKSSLADAYNLHMLYMYNEDFLYRLGAAKWNYHRAIPKHGEGHAKKSPQRVGKLNFAREFAADRYYGLSFENYFQSYLNNCRCGAKTYGMWDECTCDLAKCTFEFRLFNTTVNTTKIHAYLAICQSLVAKAIAMPEITDSDEYPPLDFIPKKWSDLTTTERTLLTEGWEQRIEYFANELPLTTEEKRSVYYCVQNSEVGKAVSNASVLLKEDN